MNARTSVIPFNFLDAGKTYVATIYADANTAHYKTNPQAYTIRKVIVTDRSVLKQFVAAGGGYAISFTEANNEQIRSMEKL
jgi:hypothetical protein